MVACYIWVKASENRNRIACDEKQTAILLAFANKEYANFKYSLYHLYLSRKFTMAEHGGNLDGLVEPIKGGQIKKGMYALLNGKPCRVQNSPILKISL